MKLSILAALAASLLAPTPVHAATPGASEGSAWLATQLTGGVVHNDEYAFDDYGLTLDIGLGLAQVGGESAMARQIRQTMSSRIDDYVTGGAYGSPDYRLAGELAKSLVFAQVSGADPTTYGGYNLVAESEGTVITGGPSAGRVENLSPGWSDYANTVSQSYAARGLSNAGSPTAAAVTGFLLDQQCDGGWFRVYFTADKTAADQGCTASDPTDTDATAFAVTQLAAITQRTPQVNAAIARAVTWLGATQRSDGSFVGSAGTPDANSNSTGLAAAALGASGWCEAAGRAAEWVSTLQVAPQPAGSPLAGEDGAIAYSTSSLAAARTSGISVPARYEWRLATAQAAAGLRYRLGSAAGRAVAGPGGDQEPGAKVVLHGEGFDAGDRFCLSGPGLDSTPVVAGVDGAISARVTLPAAAGPATYTFVGRDATLQTRVDVRVPQALASTSGVTLEGPVGFQRAGREVALKVRGAAPGSHFTLRGPAVDVPLVVGPDGVLSRLVTLPWTTGPADYALVGSDGQSVLRVPVLAKAKFEVKAKRKKVHVGRKQKIVVTGLAAGEPARIKLAGRTIGGRTIRAKANSAGRVVIKVKVTGSPGRARVAVVGGFSNRRGASTFVVRG